jgi:ribonucleotide reductase beta subunit family protein with ferritin-like domain
MVNILKEHKTYTFEYPQAIEFCEKQEDIFWTAKEIALEKDLHDLKSELTEAELHGVTTVLRLFTEYELRVGGDYWLGRMMNSFHRPELQRMFASFGAIELNVHAPFYAKINELLGLNTDEFYSSYINDHILVARLGSIQEAVSSKDLLYSLGCFSIVEGAVLYSNFGFLKHFQAEGKNKLMNLVAGINFSVRDENLHSLAGAWLYKQLFQELQANYVQNMERLVNFCNTVRDHEHKIIDMIFEKGKIVGITEHQLKNFVDSRLNLCMQQLGFQPLYEVNYNPIASWFYKNLQSSQLHDFFQKQGNSYNRDWKEQNFNWTLAEGA